MTFVYISLWLLTGVVALVGELIWLDWSICARYRGHIDWTWVVHKSTRLDAGFVVLMGPLAAIIFLAIEVAEAMRGRYPQ